jgi:hypothetical protein
MSGRRCKALRKQFAKERGRRPRKAEVELVKNWKAEDTPITDPETRQSTTKLFNAFYFLGRIVGLNRLHVVTPSEWRRLKKAYPRAA